ncbi:unnamed protein product, partial [Brassica napus]
QEELAKTQATGAAVISDPMDTESGLQVVKSLIGNVTEVDDGADTDRIMEMDEIRGVFLEHGVDMDAADLKECSEGEMEEALRELEQASGEENREVEEVTKVEDDKDMADGDVGKKNGSRKRLFEPTISTTASTKMRLAKALVSPRKRAVVFSLVDFVYYQVRGSQENEGLQNSTLILWAGVRERACCFKKAGQHTTFGSSYGTKSWSQDEENMWSIDIRGLLWLLGTVYWFGYWDDDFRLPFWMHSLCWVSFNPTQRVLAMRRMGLSRESRSRLIASNMVTRDLALMRWDC